MIDLPHDDLFLFERASTAKGSATDGASPPFEASVRDFNLFGQPTVQVSEGHILYLVNEFWTSRQRQAHSIHEISYRACFKPQLPEFFIERLTKPGDSVFDPFCGRGTVIAHLGSSTLTDSKDSILHFAFSATSSRKVITHLGDRVAFRCDKECASGGFVNDG